jgi:hypothetical protein
MRGENRANEESALGRFELSPMSRPDMPGVDVLRRPSARNDLRSSAVRKRTFPRGNWAWISPPAAGYQTRPRKRNVLTAIIKPMIPIET